MKNNFENEVKKD